MISITGRWPFLLLLLLCGALSAWPQPARSKKESVRQGRDTIHAIPALSQITLSGHPRLFFGKSDEAIIREKAQKNPLLAQVISFLKEEADRQLSATPQVYKPDAELLSVSRNQIARLLTLSMAYRLFNDPVYAKKAEEELLNVCRFPSWHPEHFLDVAEMATAVAIGYDWCYGYLSPQTRAAVEAAIRDKAFAPAWPIYESTDKTTPFNRENNWNMVCNSGMVTAAIAIGDLYKEEAGRVIRYAVQYTPHLLQSFAPEGVFNEGPGYWAYNSMYMAILFDNLQRNLHTGFGLPEYAGISNTGRFYAALIGPSGQTFNYGDASTRVDNSGTFFYLSRHYRKPEIAGFYRNLIRSVLKDHTEKDFELSRFFFLCIPWFDETIVSRKEAAQPLQVFKGVTDFVVLNGGSVSDSSRLYLAAKTGRPEWSHNQLDVGSFVLDCNGVRWGIDLGPDSYSLPKFWDYKPGGTRWTYFRNTNLAHNTLSVDDKITTSAGQGELERLDEKAAKPFAVFNITASYAGQARSVLRGFKLLSKDAVLIRDEVELNRDAGKLSWRFFTYAAVAVEGGTARLSQNGQEFYIRCLLPQEGYTMSVHTVKPYTAAEKPVSGVSCIEITVNAPGSKITIPVLAGNHPGALQQTDETKKALKEW